MNNLARLAMVVGVLSLACGPAGGAPAGAAEEFRYRRVPLDATVPAGFDAFDPVSVLDDGRVYGNAYACSAGGCKSFVAVHNKGVTTVLRQGFASDANERGTVGGTVSLGRVGSQVQAALFTGREMRRIPRLPGEVSSFVARLTDSGIALVESFSDVAVSYYLYQNRRVTPLDFGSISPFSLDINDRGIIAGTTFVSDLEHYRAFRFRPPAGPATLLDPVPPDPEAFGQGINNAGEVLGYSFTFGGLERIGFWRGREFHTRFVEGTPEFPTVSNRLLWNERRLIVITDTTDLDSYLVPRAGVRLRLADLVDGLPPWTLIVDVNDGGDLIGFGGPARFKIAESFLLRRVDAASARAAGAASGGTARLTAANPALHAARLAALLARRPAVLKEERPADR